MPAIIANMWMPTLQDLGRLSPLWAIIATIVALLLGATFVFGRNWYAAGTVTMVGGLITAGTCWHRFTVTPDHWAGLSPPGAPAMLVADQFSSCFIFLLSIFLVLVVALWFLGQNANLPEALARKHDSVEFFTLLLGSAFGMALMVSTTNLLMIVLAVETASLPSYAIAGFRKRHRLAAEASLKYVLFGAVTSAIMIYGVSLLYGHYKTLDLIQIGAGIAQETENARLAVLPAIAIFATLVGVAFKVSAVPFHFWCPDVFEGASIEVTTWLSVASKAAGLGLMLRIMSALASNLTSNAPLLYITFPIGVMAALTCTVGNLSAYRQTNLKRLLAYSSIAHAGYMLMAVAVIWRPDWTPPSPDAAGGLIAHPAFSVIAAYLVVYLFMNLGAFAIVAMVYWSTGKETLDAFNGLGRRNPALAVMMCVCLFSLIGLPPMGGFIAKYYLLAALYDAHLIWLVFVAVFNTLISLYYYLRIVYAMYFTPSEQPAIRAPVLGQLMTAFCCLIVLFTGTLAAPHLKRFADDRSRNLFAVSQLQQPARIGANAAGKTRSIVAAQSSPKSTTGQ